MKEPTGPPTVVRSHVPRPVAVHVRPDDFSLHERGGGGGAAPPGAGPVPPLSPGGRVQTRVGQI
eukprot:3860560-Prymnesium_polylepis.1